MMVFRWRWVAVLMVVAVQGLAQDAEVTIRKVAGDANPKLFVAEFTGPPAIRDSWTQVLQRSNWFAVVGDAAQAAYVVSVVYEPGPPEAITMEISAGGRVAGRIRQTGGGSRPHWVVYQSVDALIGKIFGVPGPCASRIAFARGGPGGKEVFACNFDGTDPEQLTRNGSISTEPAWGPAGKSLVYTLYDRNQTRIVYVDLLRRRQRRLSAFPGLNAGADLAPSGELAALCLSRDDRVELYVMRVTDGALKRLTNDIAVESSPCWSPDGGRICFVSDRAGRPQLYVMKANGGGCRRLLDDAAESVSPDWSSVSDAICFSTRDNGRYVIGVVPMSGDDRRKRIIDLPAGDWESPSWAPDGRHVVCTHRVGRARELSMVDTRTGRVIPVTTPGPFSLPDWSSR